MTLVKIFSITTIFFLCFLGGCKRKCSVESQIITDCNHKYWNLVYYKHYWGNQGSYRFGINGTCYWLKFYKDTKKRAPFYVDDAFYSDTWAFVDNNRIKIRGDEYYIARISFDSVVLLSSLNHDTTVLVPSEDQKDEYDFMDK